MTDDDIVSSTFVVVNMERGVWGRSSNLRGALRDAGWRKGMDEFPPGVQVWLNLQGEEDRCTSEKVAAGVFKRWDEAVKAGDFAMPFVTGDDVVYNGVLIKIW